MGYKMKTKIDLTDKMMKSAKSLEGAKVNVGVLAGEHAWLASIHEY